MANRKKSSLVRMPDELKQRINLFRLDVAAKDKKVLNQSEAMRQFAEESYTRYDKVSDVIKKRIFKNP